MNYLIDIPKYLEDYKILVNFSIGEKKIFGRLYGQMELTLPPIAFRILENQLNKRVEQ